MNPYRLQSNGSGQQLYLSGGVTIEHARDLHAALVVALSGATTLHIDAREVSRLDAAIVQVLLAAARIAAHTEIGAASAAWAQAFQRFGFPAAALCSAPNPRS